MKKIYIAVIMEFKNGKVVNQWRLHFENEELAEKQLRNAKDAGLDGYTHSYTIEREIINFKNIKHGKTA